MILDRVIFEKLHTFSENICNDFHIDEPKNRQSLTKYLETLKNGIDFGEINCLFIGMVLYDFISSKETRDRHTTARIFEDIFGELVGAVATDTQTRINPEVPDYIKKYDYLCANADWKISKDLSSNKREKADHKIDNYNLSIKTLKGKLYDNDNNIIDNNFNDEINIGSLSHRALFIGLTSQSLSDRKGGLGSPRQTIPLLNSIKENNLFSEFKSRINDYIKYVYSDDILIVYKSGYKMKITLIPAETFVNAITKALDDDTNGIKSFTKIWYRWENNNLRIRYSALIDVIKSLNLNCFECTLNLEKVFENKDFINNIILLEKLLAEKIEDLI
ncbi:MAG: hypothetical protein RR201_01860 [Malacoplasma sp.]